MSSRRVRVVSVAATLMLAGSLVACGGDSTVDSDDDASGVPSVSSSPDAGKSTGKESGKDSGKESASSSPTPEPGSGEDAPRDGEVNEVDEADEPGGQAASRTKEDDAFLAELKDNDINPDDPEVQDQVIAAAREQCLAKEEGREGFAVPMVAGQLEALELTDVPADEAGRIIAAAAEKHYCS